MGAVGFVPGVPNEMTYAELRCLSSKLTAEGTVWSYYERNSLALDQRWTKYGNGFAGACGENSDNVVVLGFEDSTQKELLILAGEGGVFTTCITGQDGEELCIL